MKEHVELINIFYIWTIYYIHIIGAINYTWNIIKSSKTNVKLTNNNIKIAENNGGGDSGGIFL